MAKKIQELESLLGKQSEKAPQHLANNATEKDAKDAKIEALKKALTLANDNNKKRKYSDRPEWPKNDQPDKGWGRERILARYPGKGSWCWSCGHDMPPGHDSKNCKWAKEGHKHNATVNNQMGGSQRNKHLCVNCP